MLLIVSILAGVRHNNLIQLLSLACGLSNSSLSLNPSRGDTRDLVPEMEGVGINLLIMHRTFAENQGAESNHIGALGQRDAVRIGHPHGQVLHRDIGQIEPF